MNRKEIDPTSGPWAPFGVQLRRSREAAGLTQAQLAKKCGFDPSYVSFAELARREPSEKFARQADEVLQTGGTLSLMWWQHRHTALLPGFPEFASHELDATEIRLFEIGVIPGLLQTEGYATALANGRIRRGKVTREQAAERVAFLLARQLCLKRTRPPLVHAVLDESCLVRPIGGSDVMIEQLQFLEELADRPNIVLQVAPFSLGEDRPFAHPVTLLTLPKGRVLAYTETERRGYLEKEAEAVAPLDKEYDRLLVEALNQAASVELIRATREGVESGRRSG